jgi:hypothetical protein
MYRNTLCKKYVCITDPNNVLRRRFCQVNTKQEVHKYSGEHQQLSSKNVLVSIIKAKMN